MNLDSERELKSNSQKAELEQVKEKTKTDEQIRLYQAKMEIDEQYKQKEHERAKELLQIESSLGIVSDVAKTQSSVPVS
jgi:hypothetical protein